jgi:DMSO/TMAO reductase YedYZ molybdopterin-dependent catalytic subunit
MKPISERDCLFCQRYPSEKKDWAYELSGKPLPILHGFPLRAVFPSMQGNNWVKWLVEIQIG